MKRHSTFRTSKFSFLLFGTGVGLACLASSTYAQTSNRSSTVDWSSEFSLQVRAPSSVPLSKLTSLESTAGSLGSVASGESKNTIRSPRDLMAVVDKSGWMTETDSSVQEDSPYAEQENVQLNRSFNPNFKLNPSVVTPPNNAVVVDTDNFAQSAKFEAPETKRTSSIVVDSAAFEQFAIPELEVPQPEVPAFEPQVAYQFPRRARALRPTGYQNEFAQADSIPAEQAIPSANTTADFRPMTNTANQFSHIQISASSDRSDRFAAAIPTTVQTPGSTMIIDPATIEVSHKPLMPIEPMQVKPAQIALKPMPPTKPQVTRSETGSASAAVSVFVDGPELLGVNQTGDYRISIVNSSFEAAPISSIQLQLPASAEVIMIEREAQINDGDRTLTWSNTELASGQQERIRFRLKVRTAGKFDFPVTVMQDGRESQTISRTTWVK